MFSNDVTAPAYFRAMNLFARKIYGNTPDQWLLALGILLASLVLARVFSWLLTKVLRQFTKRTSTSLDDLIIKRIDTPVALGIVLIGFRLALEELHFSRAIENYLQRGFVFMSALAITWLITRVVRAIIEEYFRKQADAQRFSLSDQMMMLSKRASVMLLWSVGVIVGLNNAGFDVGALIAGLGIGGLAVALAAQDTVKNIIGGLIVFADKPFRLGDLIKVKDIEGTVVYIGIRSSRIRTAAGRLVTLPNTIFSDNPIENITREPSKRVVQMLPLSTGTSAQKMDEALKILRSLLDESPHITARESSVHFEKISTTSLDLNFTYFIKKESDILQTQSEVHTEVLKRLAQAGIELAKPVSSVVNINSAAA